jgi:hypothetical protein
MQEVRLSIASSDGDTNAMPYEKTMGYPAAIQRNTMLAFFRPYASEETERERERKQATM